MSSFIEKQAAEKWCPFFRSAIAKVMSENPEWTTNRDEIVTSVGQLQSRCLGSRCAAWRWDRTNVKRSNLSPEDRDAGFHDDKPADDLVTATRTYGHCGMAGPVFE